MDNKQLTDIEKAFKVINSKMKPLSLLDKYTNGPQPLKYSTRRLEEAFDKIETHFEINWLSVVVESVLDRLNLLGFDISTDAAANDKIDAIFDKIHLDVQADKAHLAALSMEHAFLIVWKGADNLIQAYYNDPRMCHIFYDENKPEVKSFAAKKFRRADGRHQITLYYKDRLEHWITANAKDDPKVTDYRMEENPEPNPYGVIPVFEFETDGEIAKVITLQDAINKLFADMMVAAEFGAFVQRWVISQSDPGDLKNGPNQIWWLPAGDGSGQSASVGQFTPTALTGYLDAMDKLASNIAIITRTPKHYFMTTGSNISGEALLAMESPLVKKVKKRQMVLGAVWQEVAKFLLQLDGVTIDAGDITVTWEVPESVQPKTEAETRQIAINTGIPLVTQLKREGWTEAELEGLSDDQKADKLNSKTLAQGVLDALRIKNEQDNNGTA